jgi:hypothetical protein
MKSASIRKFFQDDELLAKLRSVFWNERNCRKQKLFAANQKEEDNASWWPYAICEIRPKCMSKTMKTLIIANVLSMLESGISNIQFRRITRVCTFKAM